MYVRASWGAAVLRPYMFCDRPEYCDHAEFWDGAEFCALRSSGASVDHHFCEGDYVRLQKNEDADE